MHRIVPSLIIFLFTSITAIAEPDVWSTFEQFYNWPVWNQTDVSQNFCLGMGANGNAGSFCSGIGNGVNMNGFGNVYVGLGDTFGATSQRTLLLGNALTNGGFSFGGAIGDFASMQGNNGFWLGNPGVSSNAFNWFVSSNSYANTNFAYEGVYSNGLTLNGSRITSWPSGGSGGFNGSSVYFTTNAGLVVWPIFTNVTSTNVFVNSGVTNTYGGSPGLINGTNQSASLQNSNLWGAGYDAVITQNGTSSMSPAGVTSFSFNGNGTNLQGVVVTNNATLNSVPVFTGTGTGINGITWESNAQSSLTTTNFILSTTYSNGTGTAILISSAYTNQVAAVVGNSTITLTISNAGYQSPSNYVLGENSLITSIAMVYSNSFTMPVSTNGTYSIANTSTGAGNVSGLKIGTGTILSIGSQVTGGGSASTFSSQFSGNGGLGTNYVNTNQPFYQLGVCKSYNGYGYEFSTTGSISTGSPHTLTLTSGGASFKIGGGVWVQGAGQSGSNFISMITGIAGNVLTISGTALTTVSGGVVKCDDTTAINNALADDANFGGGRVVWFESQNTNGITGQYHCGGPMIGLGNSVLTIPIYTNYTNLGFFRTITFDSEGCGMQTNSSSAPTFSGTILDFSDCQASGPMNANGSYSSCISAGLSSTVIGAGSANNYNTNFNGVNINFNHIAVIVPANTNIGGLNFGNAVAADMGNNFYIQCIDPLTGKWVYPTNSSIGLYLPQTDNNMVIHCGQGFVVGFNDGIRVSDGTKLDGPYVVYCTNGIRLMQSLHLIDGFVRVQLDNNPLYADSGITNCAIDLDVSLEPANGGSANGLWTNQTILSGPGSALVRGHVNYEAWSNYVGNFQTIFSPAASGVTFVNMADLPATQTTNLAAAASSVTFSVPSSYNNMHLSFSGTCNAATINATVYVQFNGDGGTNYNTLYTYNNQNNIAASKPVLTGILPAETGCFFGNVPGTTSTYYPNGLGTYIGDVIGYRGGGWKNIVDNGMYVHVNTEQDIFDSTWINTAPITSVTFVCSSGSFNAGTIISMHCQ